MDDKVDTSRSTSALSLKSRESEIIKTPWYYWNIIRRVVLSRIKPKLNNLTITHGVQQVGSIIADDIIYRVIFNTQLKAHIVLDTNGFHLYNKNGLREFFKLPTLITDFLYVPKVNQYVGWCHDRKLTVLSDTFEIISTAKSPDRIACVKYNEITHELITGGVGNMTIWMFRHNARHLVPTHIIQDNLTQQHTVELLAVEQTASRSQRCFGAVGNSVQIFYSRKNQHIGTLNNIHIKKITCLMFYDPLKNLVTAAKDGSVKVWDNNYNLRLVFVGHSDEVSCLSSYPFGPYIVSGSRDATIRVWSLETFDEVNRMVNDGPVEGIWSKFGYDYMLSFTSWSVHGWKTKHCHNVLAAVGSAVKNLRFYSHPKNPPRTFCIAADSAVRTIDTNTGDVMSTLLMPMSVTILDIAYSSKTDFLFATISDGTIVKSAASTNPCRILSIWRTSQEKDDLIVRICAYDYSEDEKEKSKDGGWGSLATAIQAGTAGHETVPTVSLLFGGRRNGTISLYDARADEQPIYELEAHAGEITSMEVNAFRDQIISAAKDNTVKVWRVHPFSDTKLLPVMVFYCNQMPRQLAIIDEKLMVAFHEPSRGDFSTVLYNVIHKNRSNHNIEDDHTEYITGVAACPKMKLFATASIDGTVRIWDEYNQLQRIIKLNAKPNGISFCSNRGDILIGIGSHIHKICYEDYLPDGYLQHMVVMQFPHVPDNRTIKQRREYIATLPHVDKKRLMIAKATVHVSNEYVDVLDDEEALEQKVIRETKEKGYAQIKARDEELQAIRDGTFFPKSPAKKDKPKVNRQALRKYLDLFYKSIYYKKTQVQLDSDDEYASDSSIKDTGESLKMPKLPETGFFRRPLKKQLIRYQIINDTALAKDGYVPNSVLARALYQDDEFDENALLEDMLNWEIPQLTDEQLAFLESRKIKIPTDNENSPNLPKSSSYFDRIQRALRDSNSPDMSDESWTDTAISDGDDPEIFPRTPVEKHLSRPLKEKLKKQYFTRKEEIETTPTPPPPESPRTPTPEPPKRVIPNFIMQFKDEAWFQDCFPDPYDELFPQFDGILQFIDALTIKLKVPNSPAKIGILQAISVLLNQLGEPLENRQSIIRAILVELRKEELKEVNQSNKVIIAALRTLKRLRAESETEYIAELLVQTADGAEEIKNVALTILYQLGLQDLHNMLTKELEAWEFEKKFPESRDRKRRLNDFAEAWLWKWMNKFDEHINIYHKRVSRDASREQTKTKKTSQKNRVSNKMKTKSKDKRNKQDQDALDFLVTDYLKKKVTLIQTKTEVDIISAIPSPESTTKQYITPMEGLNYYCELAKEEEFEKSRQESKRRLHEREAGKNAVLILPKIQGKPCLARIGETHISTCHADREFAHNIVSPPERQSKKSGFANNLALRMKVMTLKPFNAPKTQYYGHYENNNLLILQTSQKYFVPSRSYAATVKN